MMKKFLYRIGIIFMICITLMFASGNTISQAKIKLEDGEFYYTGTQEAEPSYEDSFWDKILQLLAEIADYIVGIMTLGVRGIIVGWIEIMEIILTAILTLENNFGDLITTDVSTYAKEIVNIESILFNRVQILDANIFKEIE